jgi:hypothetical protein
VVAGVLDDRQLPHLFIDQSRGRQLSVLSAKSDDFGLEFANAIPKPPQLGGST